jgi:hypothetical protein
VKVEAGVIATDPELLAGGIAEAVAVVFKEDLGGAVGEAKSQLEGSFEGAS